MKTGIRCRIYGAMSIVDGVATAHSEPIDVHTMTQDEISKDLAELSEERRKARIKAARANQQLQYARKRLPKPAP